ncbi:phosphoenolpyruvate synthase [Bacillus sp. 165]|uniref:phosphoenolpyruvate synthase n=1 Tax=Bacillus sp. 165 TaxID=1529117 RepID=UPI001ADCEE42|nr:phosphoenolpyruvate synthase [Bacillus sp. 165]MBO9129392.1 phosphoenolpyruvate synthase [Bacillus sp. 165]
MRNSSVLFFNQIDRSSLSVVGGKGANLGELSKAGFPVPGGFCITTDAYKEFVAASPEMNSMLDELNTLDPNDLQYLRKLGQRIRTHLQQLQFSSQLRREVIRAWESVGKEHAYAVRSSATAEDLPTASFAGQQDTYLNIKGEKALLQHIQQCWASLFTDRAISYRAKNKFDHRHVYLSVVVQRMVNPEFSGIMFTADPVTGNRQVVSIDASFGLGEALVSGIVSADLYKVKNGDITEKNISEKKLAIFSLPEGGTVKQDLPSEQQTMQALTDSQIISLAELGKRIEAHFQSPQDIEFCIENGEMFIVQSRPITSLYPLLDLPQEPLRVMISVGHLQVMTDAIKPLGLSVLRKLFRGGGTVLREGGGRLFLDLSDVLHHKIGKRIVPKVIGNAEDTISRALEEIAKRPEFYNAPSKPGAIKALIAFIRPILKEGLRHLRKYDPAVAKKQVELFMENKRKQVQQDMRRLQGTERLERMQYHFDTLGLEVFQHIIPKMVAFILSSVLLKKALVRWLGDDKEFYQLNKSLPGNVTSEMGLMIGDLADIVRDLPEVEQYLKHATDSTFYQGLANVSGGEMFLQAFDLFIAQYGMRCPGEIDITKPRWREAPMQLIPAILGHMRSVKENEHREKFAQGEREAHEAAERILYQVRYNPIKKKLLKRLITVFRGLGGLREHHKYLFICALDECKKVIMDEAEELVKKGVFEQAEDVYFLTLDELISLVQGTYTENVTQSVIQRKEQYGYYQTLQPPRVVTSEGESITGAPRKGKFPEGAFIGSPVSAGVMEGIARVILSPEKAHLNKGEILVAPHTDPGWTPLFQSARALVTEVGGLMTHGSVVAREYGIPAVVGVDGATERIKDGQMIRVDGNQGFVEIISEINE